jgi:hypothetical protein
MLSFSNPVGLTPMKTYIDLELKRTRLCLSPPLNRQFYLSALLLYCLNSNTDLPTSYTPTASTVHYLDLDLPKYPNLDLPKFPDS